MAQRFGGQYSPGGKGAPVAAGSTSRSAASGAVNLLFLVPLPLAVRAFLGDGATALALNLLALGVLLLAAWLTREGIKAQEAYAARKIARRPAIPRKIAGSFLTGIGLAIAGFAASGSGVSAGIYLILGAILHFLAFGPDPLNDKGMEGIDLHQTDRVARAVDKAEAYLTAMSDAITRARDRQASDRLAEFQASVRTMLRTVENDPRDLTSARKYLSVYLMGARDATVRFADIQAQSQDQDARDDYLALLSDMQANFDAKTDTLLQDNKADLDIEISVLRDRLERDGIHLSND